MAEKIKSLVFFDMDGTLLSSKTTILPEVSQAVRQLKANGNIPVICTGRAAFEVRHFMKECEINSLIATNGQYGEFNGQVAFNLMISSTICQKVLTYAQSRNDIIGFYNYRQIALSDDQPLSRKFYQNISSPFPQVNPDFYKDNPVNQLLVITHHADTEYSRLFPELRFMITGSQSIDTVLQNNSKGQGILRLLKQENLSVPTYAFGDGNNDLTMFDVVDCGIAMANGNSAIKNAATYVTDTNDNLGIVKALKKLKLI
ncbi:Cof-type HAD-IIB family hydrolase [Lactobacillus sp. ESL0785]|uniref:Cof-type HAD-IIB family hydrolase n=1 Tax=Lactobacillus sp. ESL0785 TaxID=2983232 RepID=UPI0023F65A1C|nr:Cof-type HAD-IIB family hydrolase [Lactobacillus sp. ESL0785]WEV70259.1 Cof-type HAD-IIB family hydrolase [Lactobacillus sp. ESL0785]